MDGAHGDMSGSAARVVVLRAAREALEREVEGRREETGGMILGRWSGGGDTLVVSGFTGPGPRAVHRACHFSADPEHQQRCLDKAVERWGAGYVGEWHLHPGSLSQPSEWDRQQVRALLDDAKRPLDRVVIVIVNQDAGSGPRVFPYLGRLERGLVVFRPLAWDEVGLRLHGEMRIDPRPSAAPAATEQTVKEPTPVPAAEITAMEGTVRSNGHGLARRLVKVIGKGLIRLGSGLAGRGDEERTRPDDEGPAVLRPFTCETSVVAMRDRSSLEVGKAPIHDDGRIVPWHETADGRQRLADEKRRLDRAGLAYEALLLRRGEIAFRFQEPGGGELVAVCRAGFPRLEPQLIRRAGAGIGPWEWVESTSHDPWRLDSHLADVVEAVLRQRGRAGDSDGPGRWS